MVFYIYKIVGVNYIGSTNNIKQRTQAHKDRCWSKTSSGYNLLLYQHIRKKNIDIQLEILFCYKGNCSNKIQRLLEQFYINKYDSKNNGMNILNAFINKKKYKKKYMKIYHKENKEKINKKSRKYYEKNKEKLIQQKKIYCAKNKDKLKKYREEHKEEYKIRCKKYHEENKEKIKERKKIYHKKNKEQINKKSRIYHKKNKEKISEKTKIKINCPICNSLIRKYSLNRHQKSQKCKTYKKVILLGRFIL